jgi:hypothetical protein
MIERQQEEHILPNGKRIYECGMNHIDVWPVGGARYSIAVYRHEDGYECNRAGESVARFVPGYPKEATDGDADPD